MIVMSSHFEEDGWIRLAEALRQAFPAEAATGREERASAADESPEQGYLTLYRGCGLGTYWHDHDARLTGFVPPFPDARPGLDHLMQFVARAQTAGPYISLTRSYSVAWSYGVFAGRDYPTKEKPAYVYEIEIPVPLPPGIVLLDPLQEVVRAMPPVTSRRSYQHDGGQDFISWLMDPMRLTPSSRAPGSESPRVKLTPQFSIELETILRTLRDAEIVAIGNIPPSFVRSRYEVFLEAEQSD